MTSTEEPIGISGYLTSTPPIPGRVKARPEDFVVEEIARSFPVSKEGRFLFVRVTARNWETNRLVRELSRRLGISRRRISFAGTKDKRAVTTQLMSFAGVDTEDVLRIGLKDVDLEPQGKTDRGLRLGDHLGNRFTIVIRDVPLHRDETALRLDSLAGELRKEGGFPNFFGPQRFGESRPITHLVGRELVRGDLEAAVETYLGCPQPGEPADTFEARQTYQESKDVVRALREYPKRLSFEAALLNHLRNNPGDYGGALKRLPLNLLTLFVYAYQSYLYNRILSERLKRGLGLREPLIGDLVVPTDKRGAPRRDRIVEVKDTNLQKVGHQLVQGKAWITGLLVGYKAPFARGQMGELERKVVEEERVNPDDFVVSAMPRLASQGLRRELLAPLMDLSYSVKGEILLSFKLHPGSYATSLLREVTKGESP